jgi:hypothetical protein
MGSCLSNEILGFDNIGVGNFVIIKFCVMGLQTFYGKGPHTSLWAGSRAARGKITVSVMPDRFNYCVIVIVYAQFTSVASGRITQPGAPGVGDPCSLLRPGTFVL